MINEPFDIPPAEDQPATTRRGRFKAAFRGWYYRRRFYLWLAGFLFVMLVVTLARHMFFTIPAGHAGVVFLRFFGGTQTETVRDEGFQFVFAWDALTIYDVRIQQVSHSFEVISRDGLEVGITISIRYRPRIELLGVLHKEVGPNYVNTIVIPEVQSLARSTFGAYTPDEMYTTKRSLIEETLHRAVGQVGERYVTLDDLLVKEIKLPPLLQTAIENKHIEQQNALAMIFRINREEDEAKRKVIEGGGVAKFNDLVRPGLNEDILRYKGIEATLKLAESPNAKIVVIGDRNGLPLILDSSPTPPRPASSTTGKTDRATSVATSTETTTSVAQAATSALNLSALPRVSSIVPAAMPDVGAMSPTTPPEPTPKPAKPAKSASPTAPSASR